MRKIVCPLIAPMFTPFEADGSLDQRAVPGLVEWLARKGVGAVYVRSGIGSKWRLKLSEVERLTELYVSASKGRLKILVGCEGEWDGDLKRPPDPEVYMKQSCELAKFAERTGADGIFLTMPFMLGPRASGSALDVSLRYFSAVRGATKLPILLHQTRAVPPEFRLTEPLLRGLLELGGFLGVKVATNEASELARVAGIAKGKDFALICGNEALWLRALELGAMSVIGGGCNVYPELLSAVRERFLAGDVEGARRAQEAILEAMRVPGRFGLEGSIFWRQYLALRGVPIKPFERGKRTKPYPHNVVLRAARAVDDVVKRDLGEEAW